MDDIIMLLQESFFNNDDEHPLYYVSDPDNNIVDHSRRLSFECTEVIHNSDDISLEKEFEKLMDYLYICARTNHPDRVVGKRVSMIPSNCKRRNTHWT